MHSWELRVLNVEAGSKSESKVLWELGMELSGDGLGG